MPDTPVVRSLLETDLYKFTMWQALLHRHPAGEAEYEFRCRNKPQFPLASLRADVERELDHLCTLGFSGDELAYLRSLRYIKSDFVDFLTLFRFQRRFIEVDVDGEHLRIRARGPIVHVMGFEIFVLYIVNELYFRRFDQQAALQEARRRLDAKLELLAEYDKEPPRRHAFEMFDFSVRRRYSAAWQEEAVTALAAAHPAYFKGTSNVYLARKLGLVPIGTMAHEYLYLRWDYSPKLARATKKAGLTRDMRVRRNAVATAVHLH